MWNAPVRLFYSYAHEDEELRKKLEAHLASLRREGLISEWSDRQITAGTSWGGEIDERLRSAQIILLLVSADFINSDYCHDVELELALEQHRAHTSVVIPIILRSCEWERMPFSELQALPRNGKPVTAWEDRDAAFTDIVKGIRASLTELDGNRPGIIRVPPNGPVKPEKPRKPVFRQPWLLAVLACLLIATCAVLVRSCISGGHLEYPLPDMTPKVTRQPLELPGFPLEIPSTKKEGGVDGISRPRGLGTLTIRNESDASCFVYFFPHRYPQDPRQPGEIVTPAIAARDGEHSEESFFGGCYYVVVQEAREKGWERDLGWLDFRWDQERLMTIKPEITDLPDPRDAIQHIPDVLRR